MSRVMGAALLGVDGVPIEVEVRLSSQLPRVDIVGLPEAAVRESAARVRSAIASVGHTFPDRRVTINLAPAGIKKSGAGLDLPIAIGILAAAGAIEPGALVGLGLIGELALDGRIRPVRGGVSQVLGLRAAGCGRIIVPAENGPEAALTLGVVAPAAHPGEAAGPRVELARTLADVLAALIADHGLEAPKPMESEDLALHANAFAGPDLAVVRGQVAAKRALEIAAAGGHGLLLRGAPGAGKTLLARVFPGLLPPLSRPESLETTRIWSAAGLLDPAQPFVAARPLRVPHHSATRAGLLGGGQPPRPGEVSLAHGGVLFLDELPEFERGALEALRQVLEDGRLVLSRANGHFVFPARFQLIAAANPCPCGWYRSRVKDCRCDETTIARYQAKVSGPLLDRIDLHVDVHPVPWRELDAGAGPGGETSATVRARVLRARACQAERLGGLRTNAPPTNAGIPPERLDALARPTSEARSLLGQAVARLGLSARAAHRAIRVARTIADLAEDAEIGPAAMAEAVGLRGS